jgi:ribokinase
MGETVMGGEARILPGGKGLNQAVAAARLGAETHMAGCVGDDDFGRRFLAFLDAERVDRTRVRIVAGVPTGTAVVMLADGDNAIIVAPGANMCLLPQDTADLAIGQGDICLAQFEVPVPATEAAFRRARAAGARTILNAAPAQPLPPTLLDLVDILVVNETELSAVGGVAVTADSNVEEIARIARTHVNHGRIVVATLGARGAIVVSSDGGQAVAGRQVPVVDTTGAGDCFVGAFAVALASGATPQAAARQANDAAALSVQRPGAAPSMPTLNELRQAFS